ncbi:type ISP restriction/modification enzyme [Methylocystis sp.]|uniref:type ISP restriction/modification enzyme n=1 Tax=Methylocystis sp. TaxID=1911079 RepID=UPI0025D2B09F|nr:type ISP restriction/modification enzyme [Methylocystis sp.]
MIDRFETYLLKLRETPLAEHTEHTGRAALETLLGQFAKDAHKGLRVQHEPKRERDKGAPDFKISRHGMILGYVEVKEIGTNLDKILKSDQIKRYRELSDNIILTDYLQWIWIDGAHVKAREALAFPTDLDARKIRIAPERAEAVGKLISAFFSEAPEGIGRAQQLALALATRSKLLREFLSEELIRQEREHQEERLFGLFQIFRDQVFHELTTADFADAFAQMLAYGLFLARLNSDDKQVTLRNAEEFIPGSFRLIRELVDFLSELEKDDYRDVRWVVEEVLSIVNGLDLPAIHEDLSFRARRAINRRVRAADEEEHRLFERDPFIYFYEDYLKAYDAKMRKSRGVYYTPPPIVNFIVRAVDDILKASFGIREGLADSKRVTVLDFACGTGTFLLEVFERIFDNIGGADKGRADPIVREHLLKNIYGFEYLIAPYTIAHLKLSQFLRDRGHPLKDNERLQVFLTNTLEPIEPQKNFLLPAISAEVEAAQAVKEKPILVILGNPPYSGHSKNKGAWITTAIDGYKYTVEKDDNGKEFNKPLGERNPKWLNDDYVKFIRFAQLKMDAVEEGVVGIITNHSWLDNPTFRGMRQSLMRSFDQIYVLDLHGNAKKKEVAPDGSKDENIFDIEQGVAISVFVKKPGLKRGVWRGDWWGKRLEKYTAGAEKTLRSVGFTPLVSESPNYLFLRQRKEIEKTYQTGWSLAEIFSLNGAGIVTAHDAFSTSFTTEDLIVRFERFRHAKGDVKQLHSDFSVATKEGWNILKGWKSLSESSRKTVDFVRPISYLPFDVRYIFFEDNLVWRTVRRLMDIIDETNPVLLCSRVTKDDLSATVVTTAFRHKAATRYDITYGFPLFAKSDGNRVENLSPAFREFIKARYKDHHCKAEEILGYIYAVLHAPTYRRRYAEFLRIDFPRIPFAEKREDFEELSKLGTELIEAHLFRNFPRRGLADYHGRGDNSVEKPRYVEAEARVLINETQSFAPVPKNVWEFHIGGYQVLYKYLKSRKGRRLSLDEINHVAAVADTLAFTIEQMARIDDAWAKAFPDRG